MQKIAAQQAYQRFLKRAEEEDDTEDAASNQSIVDALRRMGIGGAIGAGIGGGIPLILGERNPEHILKGMGVGGLLGGGAGGFVHGVRSKEQAGYPERMLEGGALGGAIVPGIGLLAGERDPRSLLKALGVGGLLGAGAGAASHGLNPRTEER